MAVRHRVLASAFFTPGVSRHRGAAGADRFPAAAARGARRKALVARGRLAGDRGGRGVWTRSPYLHRLPRRAAVGGGGTGDRTAAPAGGAARDSARVGDICSGRVDRGAAAHQVLRRTSAIPVCTRRPGFRVRAAASGAGIRLFGRPHAPHAELARRRQLAPQPERRARSAVAGGNCVPDRRGPRGARVVAQRRGCPRPHPAAGVARDHDPARDADGRGHSARDACAGHRARGLPAGGTRLRLAARASCPAAMGDGRGVGGAGGLRRRRPLPLLRSMGTRPGAGGGRRLLAARHGHRRLPALAAPADARAGGDSHGAAAQLSGSPAAGARHPRPARRIRELRRHLADLRLLPRPAATRGGPVSPFCPAGAADVRDLRFSALDLEQFLRLRGVPFHAEPHPRFTAYIVE